TLRFPRVRSGCITAGATQQAGEREKTLIFGGFLTKSRLAGGGPAANLQKKVKNAGGAGRGAGGGGESPGGGTRGWEGRGGAVRGAAGCGNSPGRELAGLEGAQDTRAACSSARSTTRGAWSERRR